MDWSNPDMRKGSGRHEILCTFEDLVSADGKTASSGRTIFIWFTGPFRLAEIMTVLYGTSSGAEADAAGVSLCGPRAEYGSAGVHTRRQTQRITVEKPLIVYERAGCVYGEITDMYGY